MKGFIKQAIVVLNSLQYKQEEGGGGGVNQMHPCTWVYDAYKPQFMIIFI